MPMELARNIPDYTNVLDVRYPQRHESNHWTQEEDLATRTQALLGNNTKQVVHLLINYAQSSGKSSAAEWHD